MPVKNHLHDYGDWARAGVFDSTLVRYCKRRRCTKKQIKWIRPDNPITAEEMNAKANKTYSFKAKYESICASCQLTIFPGNLVKKTQGGYQHARCPQVKKRRYTKRDN